MLNLQVAPVPVQVLGDESAMTMVWLVLAAQQTTITHYFLWNDFLNPSLTHQIDESAFVGIPVDSSMSIVTQQVFGRCKVWQVDVIHPAEFASEPGEIIFLCKASELRPIVESYINDALDTRFPKKFEETVCGLLSESYGRYLNQFCYSDTVTGLSRIWATRPA